MAKINVLIHSVRKAKPLSEQKEKKHRFNKNKCESSVLLMCIQKDTVINLTVLSYGPFVFFSAPAPKLKRTFLVEVFLEVCP